MIELLGLAAERVMEEEAGLRLLQILSPRSG